MSDSSNSAADQNRPFQFTLKMLLALTAFLALTCAIILRLGRIAFGFESIVVLSWMIYAHPKSRFVTVILLYAAIPLTLFAMFFPSIYIHAASRRSVCANNLYQLGRALINYESNHHEFPKNARLGDDGRTPFSWRIAILPEIDCADVFDGYRFNEPWNGPHNHRLASDFEIFRCLGDSDAKPGTTNYVAVVGPHTAWSPERALTKDDFPDGLANTILLVEIPNSGIHWMEPRDITVEQFKTWFKRLTDEPNLCPHTHGVNVLMGDGKVICLPPDLSPDTLDALLTRDGGETVDLNNLR